MTVITTPTTQSGVEGRKSDPFVAHKDDLAVDKPKSGCSTFRATVLSVFLAIQLYMGSTYAHEHFLRSLSSWDTQWRRQAEETTAAVHLPRILHTVHPLVSQYHYNSTFSPYYHCHKDDRVDLPPPIARVLNYTTRVTTDLRLLLMGDSVGIQMFQYFEEAAGGSARNVLQYSWGKHEGIVLNTQLRGGGQLAGWRITGMFSHKGENQASQLPNNVGGGWMRADADRLLNLSAQAVWNRPQVTERQLADGAGLFDAMVFRIPQGWMDTKDVTQEAFQDTILTAHSVFGVSTVVFVSLPLVNNVQTVADFEELHRKNQQLKQYAHAWNTNATTTTTTIRVLVLDFGHLMNQLLELNARGLGYDTSNLNYTLDHLKGRQLPSSIPLVCAERQKEGAKKCSVRNKIAVDGMHWCFDTMGGRVVAGISCLLECAYNHDNEKSASFLRQCQNQCNQRHMDISSSVY
ncbi:expressed unknown protein [Seminavis robusta]|uniref:Uncharacterized protein n=1 Tax=Seminavis robusta TaxID=568900 RepID=A0A9N8DZA9_9STRA|nr:expressed unknown protein [Seminavis robusta]|eukprot:Sro471_g149720.1 n/a (461) ;mRNA; r:31583-32965